MDDLVDVVPSRETGAFGFHFKVRATGRVYRFEPTRDPRQPRYWCFRVYRCLSTGMVDMTERPWLGGAGMTREELPAAAQVVRADPNGWLATAPLRELRRWLLEPSADPPGSASVAERPGRPWRGRDG
jgi:hypothetical protein